MECFVWSKSIGFLKGWNCLWFYWNNQWKVISDAINIIFFLLQKKKMMITKEDNSKEGNWVQIPQIISIWNTSIEDTEQALMKSIIENPKMIQFWVKPTPSKNIKTEEKY